MRAPPLRDIIFLPPDDMLRVWDERTPLQITMAWSEMVHGQHAVAFTVAKIAQLELLSKIRASLDQVIRNGGTYEQWRDNILPELRRAGWWGAVTDPALTGTSEPVIVDERRLRNIYRTNIRMSQAGGLWRKIQREKDVFPYLRYLSDHIRKEPRLNHKGWHGIILPVDHEAWQWLYPPNGWGCGCHVEQVSEGRMRRNGWTVSEPPDPDMSPFVTASGRIIDVPVNVAPGFGYNPGTAHLQAVADRLTAAIRTAVSQGSDHIARATLRDIIADTAFDQFLAMPEIDFPVSVLTAERAEQLGATARILILSRVTQAKQLARGMADRLRLPSSTYRPLATILEDFDVLAREADGLNFRIVRRHDDGRFLCVVIKRTASGQGLFVRSVRIQNSARTAAFIAGAEIIEDRRG